MTGDELGRRTRAAIAYSGKTDTEIGEALGKSGPDTIRHWKRGLFPKANRPMIINALADATGLPPAFFTADFSFLHELPQTQDPALAAERVSRLAREAAQRQSGSHGRRTGEDRRQGDRRSRS